MVDQGKLGVLVVDRDTEFAPVKNADGPTVTEDFEIAEPLPDTPAMARKMILAESTKWLQAHEQEGLQINASAKGHIEVSFLLTYAGEGLSWLLTKQASATGDRVFDGRGGYLDHEGNYIRQAH